jgi:hypothetical protein
VRRPGSTACCGCGWTTTYVIDFATLFREGATDVRVRYDRHVMGLFPRATWLSLMRDAGFEASSVRDRSGRDQFVGVLPREDRG